MIGQQGEHYEPGGRSLRKFLITIVFLFMLLLFLRKQREDEEEMQKKAKSNLRKNENYNKTYGLSYIRELSVLKYESVLYISPNRAFLPITHYLDNNTTVHVEGYDNILNQSETLSLEINKEENYVHISAIPDSRNERNGKKEFLNPNINSICVSKKNSDDICANINTVLVDTSLFKTLKITSCDSETDSACFFVFVQLEKKRCFDFTNLSYSCHANNLKNRNAFVWNDSCYVVLACSQIDSVYDFIEIELLSNKNLNEMSNTKGVEIITHFCGNIMNQLAVIDATNFRLLFIQRYIRFNEENDTPTDNKEKEEQEEEEKEEQEEKEEKEEVRTEDIKNFPNVESEDKENSNVIDNYNIEEEKFFKFRKNYYITIIDLFSENKEITEYVNYSKLKPQYTLFPPVYMGYDEQINVYFIVNYENNGALNFVFLSTESLSIFYTLRVQEFYSGWLLKPLNKNGNKGLMLLGEYAPYEDELHIWNVSNFHHNRYFVNTIKGDINV